MNLNEIFSSLYEEFTHSKKLCTEGNEWEFINSLSSAELETEHDETGVPLKDSLAAAFMVLNKGSDARKVFDKFGWPTDYYVPASKGAEIMMDMLMKPDMVAHHMALYPLTAGLLNGSDENISICKEIIKKRAGSHYKYPKDFSLAKNIAQEKGLIDVVRLIEES